MSLFLSSSSVMFPHPMVKPFPNINFSHKVEQFPKNIPVTEKNSKTIDIYIYI